MAILETEVSVVLSANTISYYENLGYEIPRSVNKYGDLTVSNGTKILVKVEDLPLNSNAKVTKICDEEDCGKYVPNRPYADVIKCRKEDNKDRCKKCATSKGAMKKKYNVKLEKTLEYYAISNSKQYLLEEFSDKNVRKPNQISYSSVDDFIWDCPDCKSEYSMKPDKRTTGNCNCPYCRGYRVNHTNCLWTTNPELSRLLKNPQRGYEITGGSNKNEILVCENCGFEQLKKINDVNRQGFRCSKCNDGIPYAEKFMFNLLEQLGINFETQCKFDWASDKKYDFYIPSLKMIIETHGGQHYFQAVGSFGMMNLKSNQANDKLKERLAKENGIEKYVIIDCRYSRWDFISKNIISSDLSKVFNLDNIDWKQCHAYSCKTLVKVVCDLWNDGLKSTLDISKKLKLGRYTATKYLKQGAELGWCNYNPKEEMIKSALNSPKSCKKVIQLTLNADFVKEWESMADIERCLGIDTSNISSACKGKYQQSGGFMWMYKEDYEENKNNLNPYVAPKTGRQSKNKIVKLDLNGDFLKEYNNAVEAGKDIGISSTAIYNVLKGKYKTTGGYKWMYKSEYDKLQQNELTTCQ